MSHPHLDERYKKITLKLNEAGADTVYQGNNSSRYTKVKEQCYFEYCEALLKMGHFDQALLYALKEMEANPESTYFKEVAFFSYFKIYEARKLHHAGLMYQYIPSITDSAQYWIRNYIILTKLSDLRLDVTDFALKYKDEINETERNIYARAMLALDQMDQRNYKILKEKYIHSYPQGK